MDALAPRKPTGRYVYESSDDESDTDPVNWRDVPRPKWWADLASDDEDEDDTDAGEHAADLSAVRLANELDPWEAWEAESRRRAWVRRVLTDPAAHLSPGPRACTARLDAARRGPQRPGGVGPAVPLPAAAERI